MLIDLGGNLLPAFAEGTKDVKVCAKRLSALYRAGVDALVLMPRYYPAKRSVEDFVKFRETVLRGLSIHMPDKCPALYLGCEVYIDERLKYIPTIGELTILGTSTLIAYMPSGEWDGSVIDTIEAIRAVGIEVLIAHIDRCSERYAGDLFKCGYRGILDASAFVGIPNLFRRKRYLSWIDKGYVVGIGSNFVVKKRWFIKVIEKVAGWIGIELDIKPNEKRIGRIIAKATKALGEERLNKLARSTAKALTGAVQITN